jgi:hypothetical protein
LLPRFFERVSLKEAKFDHSRLVDENIDPAETRGANIRGLYLSRLGHVQIEAVEMLRTPQDAP